MKGPEVAGRGLLLKKTGEQEPFPKSKRGMLAISVGSF